MSPQGQKLYTPAYHGTPHTLAPEAGAPFGRFRTSKIGTGEGAQAYGHGLYFAGRKEVAQWYFENLNREYLYDGKEFDPSNPRHDAAKIVAKHKMDEMAALDELEQRLYLSENNPYLEKLYDIVGTGKYAEISPKGTVYKVELAPKENEYLLYDKTLGEQPKGVQDKLKKFLREQEGEDTWQYRQEQDYRDITNNVLDDMPEPEISRRLKEAGIPGIKYLDGASRSKGEGDYNYVIFDEADVTVTEKLFMPQMAMKNDPSVKYHYDTQTMDRPPVKDVSALSGERLAGVLEADRHDARGGRMAGPAHPFLKSNQATATVDGIKWKPVWANMKYQFVKTQIGKQMKSTNGYNLVAIMDEFAHRSNRDVFTRMMKKIQSASKKMTPEQKLVTAQIINIFDIRYTPKKERGNKLKESMLSFVSDLGTAKSQATRNNMEGFNKLLKKSVDKVKSNSWWDSQSIKSNSKDFRKYTKDMTFNKRGAILKALEGLPWLPDIQKFLKSEMDFEGAPTDKAVLAVQLSKHKLNSDERVFAIYTGKDPDQARWMTKNEREVLRQLRADPNFREHPSYDWMMLGKADSDNFYLDKPVNLDKLIPTYRKDHKRSKTQEYKAQLSKTKNYLSKTPKSKGFLFSGKGDKADTAFLKTFSETKSKKAGIDNVFKGKERLVVGAMKRNAKVPIIIP